MVYFTLQALPLVTVVVGDNTEEEVCRILTTAESADEPRYVEFLLPAANQNRLSRGKPQWANYVKGVIANFPDNGITLLWCLFIHLLTAIFLCLFAIVSFFIYFFFLPFCVIWFSLFAVVASFEHYR